MCNYATSLVKDGGKHNNKFVRLQMKIVQGEEKIFIKYGHFNFLPVSVIINDSIVLLSAACIGSMGDIKVSIAEWIRILSTLGCKEKLIYWQSKINCVPYEV
jgi:hypothetical protein